MEPYRFEFTPMCVPILQLQNSVHEPLDGTWEAVVTLIRYVGLACSREISTDVDAQARQYRQLEVFH